MHENAAGEGREGENNPSVCLSCNQGVYIRGTFFDYYTWVIEKGHSEKPNIKI